MLASRRTARRRPGRPLDDALAHDGRRRRDRGHRLTAYLRTAFLRFALTSCGPRDTMRGGVRLLARGGVRVQHALRAGLVDQLHQRDVLGRDASRVAGVDGGLEAPELGLDRRAVPQVLEPLPLADEDALLLLLDVRHCGANATTGLASSAPSVACPAAIAARGERRRRRAARAALFSLATGLSPRRRAPARDPRGDVFGVRGAHQRVHGRLQRAEPRALAGRRRGPRRGLRAGLQRAARARASASARWRVASTVATPSAIGLPAITRAVMAPSPTPLFARRLLRGAGSDLTVQLARIMFPIVVLLGLTGIVQAILQLARRVLRAGLRAGALEHRDHRRPARRRRRFRRPTTSALRLRRRRRWSGTLVQLLFPLPWLRGRGGRAARSRFDLRDPRGAARASC